MDDAQLLHGDDRCYIPGLSYCFFPDGLGTPGKLWTVSLDQCDRQYAFCRMDHLQAEQKLFKIFCGIIFFKRLKLKTMKSILYVGATLMIGASIYGFVDYSKTRDKKEFKNMYAEKEVTAPIVEKKLSLVNTEKIETPVDDKKAADDKAAVSNTAKSKKSIAKIKKQKKRKFNTRLFSRGALDERYIKEEKIKLEEPKTKTEPGKIENKEQ